MRVSGRSGWFWKLLQVCGCVACILLPGTALQAAEAWSLLGLDSDAPLNRAERISIANDLAVRLETLRRHVPMQKPDAAEAVRGQLDTLDDMTLASEQRGRFFLSLDYQHYQLLELLDGARTELECIRTTGNAALEHTCWARLATIYLSEERLELGIGTLRAARLLPKDDDMPRPAQDPRVWYGEFGRGIVRRVLTPWLSAQVEVHATDRLPLETPIDPLPGPAGMESEGGESGGDSEPAATDDLQSEEDDG